MYVIKTEASEDRRETMVFLHFLRRRIIRRVPWRASLNLMSMNRSTSICRVCKSTSSISRLASLGEMNTSLEEKAEGHRRCEASDSGKTARFVPSRERVLTRRY